MKCKKVLESIFSAEGISPEAEAHIKNCEQCRTAYEDWQIFKDVKVNQEIPPKGIDLLILSESRNFISNRTVIRRLIFRWISLAATAACVMITAWICLDFVKSEVVEQKLNLKKPLLKNPAPAITFETTQQVKGALEPELESNLDSQSFEEMVDEELFKLNVDIEATNNLLYFSTENEEELLTDFFKS